MVPGIGGELAERDGPVEQGLAGGLQGNRLVAAKRAAEGDVTGAGRDERRSLGQRDDMVVDLKRRGRNGTAADDRRSRGVRGQAADAHNAAKDRRARAVDMTNLLVAVSVRLKLALPVFTMKATWTFAVTGTRTS